jgi:hypothetical protein
MPSLASWKRQLKIPASGKSANAVSNRFDPAALAPFSVIRCNYRFDGDPSILPDRRFVCLGHKRLDGSDFAICLKATSKLEAYKNNSPRMGGVVFYNAQEISFFEKDTIIQPDNQFPIPHSNLAKQFADKSLVVLGMMPSGFAESLVRAIEKSITMSPIKKRRLLEMLGEGGSTP